MEPNKFTVYGVYFDGKTIFLESCEAHEWGVDGLMLKERLACFHYNKRINKENASLTPEEAIKKYRLRLKGHIETSRRDIEAYEKELAALDTIQSK